jgi:hypothetical protein
MFVQIIEGTTSDVQSLRRQFDRWAQELRQGAEGFLGSTMGVTDDGRAVTIARFASEEAAVANSNRPEQAQWWAETEKCFEGTVGFTDSTDVDLLRDGGSDEAGFVQVMRSEGIDRDRVRAFDEAIDPFLDDERPDVLGGIRIWTGPDRCTEVVYFSNEDEARRGERDLSPEAQAAFAEFADLMEGVEFLDLRDPWLY